jgi:hypothetical protein
MLVSDIDGSVLFFSMHREIKKWRHCEKNNYGGFGILKAVAMKSSIS